MVELNSLINFRDESSDIKSKNNGNFLQIQEFMHPVLLTIVAADWRVWVARFAAVASSISVEA